MSSNFRQKNPKSKKIFVNNFHKIDCANNLFVGGKHVANIVVKLHYKLVKNVYVTRNWENSSFLEQFNSDKITFCTSAKLNEFCPKISHQGIVLCLKCFPYYDYHNFKNDLNLVSTNNPECAIALKGVQDENNLGSIIRTCVAFQVPYIFIENHHQCFVNSRVIKTSSGSAFLIKIIRVSNLQNVIKYCKQHNWWIYATSTKKQNSTSLKQTNFTKPWFLIFGSEHKGLPKLILKTVDYSINIPMQTNHLDSINVAFSAILVIAKACNIV